MKVAIIIIIGYLTVQSAFCETTDWPFKNPQKVQDLLSKRFPQCTDAAGGNSGKEFMVNTQIFPCAFNSFIEMEEGESGFLVKTFEEMGYEVVSEGMGSGGASDSSHDRKHKFKLKSDNENIVLFVILQHAVSKIPNESGFVTIYWCCSVN